MTRGHDLWSAQVVAFDRRKDQDERVLIFQDRKDMHRERIARTCIACAVNREVLIFSK